MQVRKMSEIMGLRVYTDSGAYFGEVEEANLSNNKVDSWRIKVSGGVTSLIGGARGVVIPHRFVRAVSDIFIINRAALPSMDSEVEEVQAA
ncbi:PRC-barrel domain-containing protein [Candidatus Pacearchaeota archaeon]|nr:PRC-barrel domain-containing protein [Candidatus Pacearchaeota archaeon]